MPVAVDRAVQLLLGDDPAGQHLAIGLAPARRGVRDVPVGIEVVARIGAALPVEPHAARAVGVEVVLDGEPELPREPLRAGAREQMMVGKVGHHAGDAGGCAHPFERRDAAGPPARPVHAAGVELHDPLGVGASAVADAGVLGVELDDADAGDERIEHVRARRHHAERGLHAGVGSAVPVAVPVRRRDDDRRDATLGDDGGRAAEDRGRGRRGETDRRGRHELATTQLVCHGRLLVARGHRTTAARGRPFRAAPRPPVGATCQLAPQSRWHAPGGRKGGEIQVSDPQWSNRAPPIDAMFVFHYFCVAENSENPA